MNRYMCLLPLTRAQYSDLLTALNDAMETRRDDVDFAGLAEDDTRDEEVAACERDCADLQKLIDHIESHSMEFGA